MKLLNSKAQCRHDRANWGSAITPDVEREEEKTCPRQIVAVLDPLVRERNLHRGPVEQQPLRAHWGGSFLHDPTKSAPATNQQHTIDKSFLSISSLLGLKACVIDPGAGPLLARIRVKTIIRRIAMATKRSGGQVPAFAERKSIIVGPGRLVEKRSGKDGGRDERLEIHHECESLATPQ